MIRIYLLIILLSSFCLNVCGQVLQKTDVIGKWTIVQANVAKSKQKQNSFFKFKDFSGAKFEFLDNGTCHLFFPNRKDIIEYSAYWDITKMNWVIVLSHNSKEKTVIREIEMLMSFKIVKKGNAIHFHLNDSPIVLEVNKDI